MHVGILEDNAMILDMLTHAMQLHGHSVSTHMTGSSLFEVLFKDTKEATIPPPYDILLADYLLPEGLTGEDIVTRIRKVYSPEQLPIIVISGTMQRHLLELNKHFPDVTVIAKPISLEYLSFQIKKVTGQ